MRWRTPRTNLCLGTWFQATRRLVRSLPGRTLFVYSDLFFLLITPQRQSLIYYRLLRSVLVNATDKPFRLKSDFCLGAWFRASETCTIASRVNSFEFVQPSSPLTSGFEVWERGFYRLLINTPKHLKILPSNSLPRLLCKTITVHKLLVIWEPPRIS